MFRNRTKARFAGDTACLCLLIGAASCIATTLPEFPPNAVWSRDISQAPLNANSTAMITATGGWGNGNVFQIDLSMHVLHVSAVNEATVPMVTVVADPDPQVGYTTPDCEPLAGLKFPLPSGGAIEGHLNYTCDNSNSGDDCHLFVALDGSRKLYESYKSNVNGSGQLESACVIVWDLQKVYPPQGRGEQCTSADGAGFPMASLLFNADEVFAASQVVNGDIGHAIRFILPNPSMASNTYVHPASHAGGPSGAANKIPYGSRLRLKSGFDINGFSANTAARVILRTMHRYGIVLSDGGNIALTAETDDYTTHKWSAFGFDEMNGPYLEQMLIGVPLGAFEVVETGPQIPLTYDCNTNGNVLVPKDFIFIDPFDY
jgi:hypothetical protein